MFGDRNTARPVRRFNPDAAMTVVLVAGFVLFLALTIAVMGWDSIGAVLLFLLFLSAG